jgi:hypothetical protein
MRLFALIGALLISGGAYLLIDGGLRLSFCMDTGQLSLNVWSDQFWLLIPAEPDHGLSPNAHWFIRLAGGLLAMALGATVLRIATR